MFHHHQVYAGRCVKQYDRDSGVLGVRRSSIELEPSTCVDCFQMHSSEQWWWFILRAKCVTINGSPQIPHQHRQCRLWLSREKYSRLQTVDTPLMFQNTSYFHDHNRVAHFRCLLHDPLPFANIWRRVGTIVVINHCQLVLATTKQNCQRGGVLLGLAGSFS